MGKPNQQARHRRSGGTTNQSPGAFGEAAGGDASLNDGDEPHTARGPRALGDARGHAHTGDHEADVDFADPAAVREHEYTEHEYADYDDRDPSNTYPHDVDPPEPDAYDESTAANGVGTRAASSPGNGDNRPAGGQEDEWGFPKEKRGMSTETKIGLALVLLLLCTFGFVVWKKLQQRSNVLASTYEEHEPITKSNATKPGREPAPKAVAHDHSHDHGDEHPIEDPPKPEPAGPGDFDDWASIEQSSRSTTRTVARKEPDPFGELDADHLRNESRYAEKTGGRAGHASVEFGDDFADFEPPKELPRQQPPKSDFAEYEFEGDLFAAEERPRDAHDHRGHGRTAEEPGRLEVVDLQAFGDPRVQPAAAEDCPTDGFDFEPRQKPIAQRNQRQSVPVNDGWGDVASNPRHSTAPPTAADCPVDDPWGGNATTQYPTGQHGQPVNHQQLGDEFCPVDPPPPGSNDVPIDHSYPAPTHEGGYPAGTRIHTVRNGDTYWTISRELYGTARYFSALAQYNADRIPNPKTMRPGMKVVIPPAEALHTRYPKLCGAGTHTVAHQNSEPAGFFVGANGSPKYRIGETDTLSDIAHSHLGRASRWVQIYELNRARLPRPETLRIGTVLDLPRDASSVRLVRTTSEYR